MTDFNKHDLSYKPLKVDASPIGTKEFAKNIDSDAEESIAIATKLVDHLTIIQEYENRLEAIDFLINNCKELSGNIAYPTDDPGLQLAIKELGGTSNIVDFKLFEKAVDVVIQGYRDMSLIALSDVEV